jgi:hypothetical protein
LPSHGTALYGGTNTSSLKIYFIFYWETRVSITLPSLKRNGFHLILTSDACRRPVMAYFYHSIKRQHKKYIQRPIHLHNLLHFKAEAFSIMWYCFT